MQHSLLDLLFAFGSWKCMIALFCHSMPWISSSAETMDLLTCLLLLQVQEKQRLIDFAEALRSKLNYFDELENVRFDC